MLVKLEFQNTGTGRFLDQRSDLGPQIPIAKEEMEDTKCYWFCPILYGAC